MPLFVVSRSLSKHIANTRLARIYLAVKMNRDCLFSYVSLPADRQEEIYLQVLSNKEQQLPQLLVNVARAAMDIPYINALIAHHHCEYNAGTHLSNTPPAYVTPTHACNRNFVDNSAEDPLRRHQSFTARHHGRELFQEDIAQDNPLDNAGAESTVA